jgi:hypothetical protein
VLEDGVIVRRIFVVPVAPEGLDVGRAVTMAIYAGRVRVCAGALGHLVA